MAAYDLEEQEQLESIKAWWRQYGNLISGVVLAVALGFAGFQGWNWYQRQQSAQASALFASLQQAENLRDTQRVQAAAGELLEKFPRTRYAEMGAMVSARLAFEDGDAKTARARLQWVVDNASDEMRDLARLRLAAVLLDEKAFDEALAALGTPEQKQFAARFGELRGDVLLAQGKRAEARTAYQQAVDALPDQSDQAAAAYRQLLAQKRDALGAGS